MKNASHLPLRQLADAAGIRIGAAVSSAALKEEIYRTTLAREFNTITPEVDMKFELIHPRPDQYSWAKADAIASFARQNSMKIRGHTLLWHRQNPPWITEGTFTRSEWMDLLRKHIHTVVSRYRDVVDQWDVANEALDDTPGHPLRQNVWYKSIGPDYLDFAFHCAHEADPAARLYYNDYSAEDLSPRSNALFEMVTAMKQRGVPVHGVGLQTHLGEYMVKPSDVIANIRRLNDLGMEVAITEMDVRIYNPVTPEKLEVQARVYQELLHALSTSRGTRTFVLWGFTDRLSWIPHEYGSHVGSALIFDEHYQPKPAYYALHQQLQALVNRK